MRASRFALHSRLPVPFIRPLSAGEGIHTKFQFNIWNGIKDLWKRSFIVKVGVLCAGIGIPSYLLCGGTLLPYFESPENAIVRAFEKGVVIIPPIWKQKWRARPFTKI